MTVIEEPIENVIGVDDNTQIEFWSPVVRSSADGAKTVTMRPYLATAVDGVLTTPDIDPGPVSVRIGQAVFHLMVPESAIPIRLLPLLEAAMPIPPAQQLDAVRNAGGIRRVAVVTESQYAALSPPDPETEYSVIPD